MADDDMQPTRFDYVEFHRELLEATRRSFTAIRKAHPDEQFYAFALYSDDSAMGVEPASNTEEELQRQRSRSKDSIADEKDYLRWGTVEWAYERAEADHFNRSYEMLSSVSPDDYDEDEFNEHRKRVFWEMIAVLDNLQEEGFFGRGEERNGITLFCTISDSFDARELELESARRLNPSLPRSPYWQ